MPTIRQIEQALAKQPPEERGAEPPSLLRLNPQVMRYQADKEAAPLVTRDILLDVLAEARATTRLARWTLVVATLAFLASVVGIVIGLLVA
jgi:hypothetical protein